MISPPAAVSSPPAGTDPARPSTRRRGLSYLRALSHTRSLNPGSSSAATSPNEASRTSPRHYFQRSLSYNENNSEPNVAHRPRSNSRPTEPTSPLAGDSRGTAPPTNSSQAKNRPASPARAAPPPPSPQPPPAQDTESAENPRPATDSGDDMARHRPSILRRTSGATQPADPPAPVTTDSTESTPRPGYMRQTAVRPAAENGETKPQLPTIRFFAHQEIRNGRPSLTFAPVSRTLPNQHAIIRVGRYSEREGVPAANPTTPSDAPVGFKSKVVSRKHCEFSFVDGQWQIRDVASSSGTFLNHIRLSQPNTESRLFPIKDGDIVQLGIDFRGGEEMIFRCVKIRIECNRAWQKKPNNFNKSRHQQLQSLSKDQPSADTNNGECSICLGSVLPCQALFVAPCAHVWHYKCIRPLLEGKNSTYPQFQCPNCRAYSDLTADVDVAQSDIEEWMDSGDADNANSNSAAEEPTMSLDAHAPAAHNGLTPNGHVTGAFEELSSISTDVVANASENTPDLAPNTPVIVTSPAEPIEETPATGSLSSSGLLARRQANNPISPEIQSMRNVDMPGRADQEDLNVTTGQNVVRTDTSDPDHAVTPGEGPLTPRNDAGPFVFDGSAGRADARQLVVPADPEVANGTSQA